MGAHSSLLEMENIRVIKGVRNAVNRLVNCDTANLNKTINASMRQVENIKYRTKIGLKTIKAFARNCRIKIAAPGCKFKELERCLFLLFPSGKPSAKKIR